MTAYGELCALRYIRGWMELKRANLNAAAESIIDEMLCHCDAAIERLERGDPMPSLSEIAVQQEIGDETEGDPIGWKIVATGNDGSVLCESPSGNHRRYWFLGREKRVDDL